MKCPKCQAENPEGVKFCGECGHRFSDVALFAGLLLAPSVSFTLEMAAVILILLASYLGSLSKAAGGLRQYGGVMGKADPMAWCTADVCRYPSDAMSRLLTRKKGARKQW